jgi:hypothetical protein
MPFWGDSRFVDTTHPQQPEHTEEGIPLRLPPATEASNSHCTQRTGTERLKTINGDIGYKGIIIALFFAASRFSQLASARNEFGLHGCSR